MALLSNALAAYTFLADHPERAALVFVSGVCVGLLLTLFALVFQVHCQTDCHYSGRRRRRHDVSGPLAETGEDSQSGDLDDVTADLSSRRRRQSERTLVRTSVFTSAEELERAQRLEDRERILREIWINGQPDLNTITHGLNHYY
ncbi:protein eva-1 homolog A-like isoform X2 [Hypomesus transpacificus]|uniref:protein eva-1 homolog A-like isoform X2 n=1 Tax=Hypomesus transpacificus TaxID=137520 RepID=UPI001F075C95|nr:protein eva-1 homolog A-like isoform X2 [Hypomesus transpacificus]